MNPWYKDYSELLSEIFPGKKVQKISVNAGFGCPNRDGTLGTGGCIYCDNSSFSPAYCHKELTVSQQILKGKEFFSRKYPQMEYLAYFQNFTGTYGDISELSALYREAISADKVCGLIIGTRPDCISSEILSELSCINRQIPVIIEYGAETSHDNTLQLINRGHTWQQVEESVYLTSEAGIRCGLHLICGLPGENSADILDTVETINRLPVDSVKFHQLQVIRGTRLHKMLEKEEIQLSCFLLEDYLDLCIRIIGTLRKDIAIERFLSSAPPSMVVSPKWGIKNYEFTNLLHNLLEKRNTSTIKTER